MKAIVVLFDSLSRKYLPPYGNDWVQAPNFTRLAEHSMTFERCFVGSMPCMPARRELHTGRANFLHRSWGPLEPFDDSMPELLKRAGTYTHLASDHYHYWEDGGCTYHTRYSSWESARGQEGDPWKGAVADPVVPPHVGHSQRQDWVNRTYLRSEADWSQTQTFDRGVEFIETNAGADNWFLQIECFDPHPPFVAPQQYRDLYPRADGERVQFDWPPYGPVKPETHTPEVIAECRREYAALISMCDQSLGRVLDTMDRLNLWEDTMLIVTTDHGFLLGEHDWWAFCAPPFYDEVAVKPLFVWDPRCARRGGRSSQVVQTLDIPATVLEYFGVALPPDMQGRPLRATVAADAPVREVAIFGVFGGHVNCTDGRYVYMRAPVAADSQPLFNYTLMPTHMRALFSPEELSRAELVPPFAFTKGCPVLRCPAKPFMARAWEFGTLLFDLERPEAGPIQDAEVENRLCRLMVQAMQANAAPREQYTRLGVLDVVAGTGSA